MDCLIIKKKYLDKIFDNNKIWEIRISRCNKRCLIGLIESKSGKIMGTCEIVDCIGPLNLKEFDLNISKHQSSNFGVKYKISYAWVLSDAKRYSTPLFYKHPLGAIIWVKVS